MLDSPDSSVTIPNMSDKIRASSGLPQVFRDCEIIADPLNRLVSISKFEKRIICCPEFQRLRRIKQLGFAHLVYPAAEYSRFTHSIGVCHQAKSIIDTINTNLGNDRRYRQWRLFGRENEQDIDDNNVLITPFERVIIAAAGLLHDLPHGPFSHEIEGILTDTGETVIPDHDKLSQNPALFLYLFDRNVSEIAVLLEYFNRFFFQALLKRLDRAPSGLKNDWRQSLVSLMDKGFLTDTGMIKVGNGGPLQYAKQPPAERFLELPFLAVAIFEILLFEKQDEWLSPTEYSKLFKDEKKPNDGDWGLIVKTDWSGDAGIRWQPLPGWFRAYRKDIIGNTICADLIDYVNRDGYHTGIVSTIDLKFLDRMTIVRAVLPTLGDDGQRSLKPPANTIDYADIPICCEHVVFDVYDHKRGFIRQSVLTEILAYLQARYLLCERVYNHRVVEAARSMLQRIILILGRINEPNGEKLLAVSNLHPLNKAGPGDSLAPIGDDALLNWVRSLPDRKPDVYRENTSEIDKTIELATLLQERRVFREAVIYDGLHGFLLPGKLGGAEVSCRALEAAFLTDSRLTGELDQCINKIETYLNDSFLRKTKGVPENAMERLNPKVRCLVGIRKWGKRNKPPLVLVSRPLKQSEAAHGSFDVEPLLDCEDPANIKKQLDALKASYDSLWKVYLFLHPVFHGKLFSEEHHEVNRLLDEFAAKYTGEMWKNAIDYNQLLQEPLDNALFLAEPEKAYFRNHYIPNAVTKLSEQFTTILRRVFPGDASRIVIGFNTDGFRNRVRDTLLKAEKSEILEQVVSRAPKIFEKSIRRKKEPEAMALAARDIEAHYQDNAIKAIGDSIASQSELDLGGE